MARKFLYLVAAIIVVVIAGRLALTFYPEQLSRMAFVPGGAFEPQPPLAKGRYDDPAMWIARPGMAKDPAHWSPADAPAAAPVRAAVFFVHPTSYLERSHWNAPLDDAQSRERAAGFTRILASPFAGAAELWAPRYRQATFGALITEGPEGNRALDLAYGDVVQAFDAFLANRNAELPIVLVGHSQGALLLQRLIAERIAHKPLARRVAVAYLPGWPLSLERDLPRLGLKACTRPGQSRCVMSWMSYGEPDDPSMMLHAYARRSGLGKGVLPADGTLLCSNPLSGGKGNAAPAAANLGALVPDISLESGRIVPALTGASCGSDGTLSLGARPEIGPLVLPGNNYHLYDIPLFWMNLRADFVARVAAWQP